MVVARPSPVIVVALVALGCAAERERGSRSLADPAGITPDGLPPDEDPATIPGPDVFESSPMASVPLFGGTLARVPELHGVLAADPEGDRLVWSRTTDLEDVPVEIPLGHGARPFRVEVEGRRAWITLRGTGEVVAVDLPSGVVAWRVKVCPEPRGLDHGPDGALVVACAGGEIVALDDTSGALERWRLLDPDLRDVVAADGILYVSRFRPGEVLLVDGDGLAPFEVARLGSGRGRMAWRMREDREGEGVILVYDEPSPDPIEADPEEEPEEEPAGPYGTLGRGCDARHQARFAHVAPDGTVTRGAGVSGVVLPVDFVVRENGSTVLVDGGSDPMRETLTGHGVIDLAWRTFSDDCIETLSYDVGWGLHSAVTEVDGQLVYQTASPATLHRWPPSYSWIAPVWGVRDVHDPDDPSILFHRSPGGGVACASCHPEGQDDGQVWMFGEGIDGVAMPGPRRTLPLAGRLLDRAPYHWMGELPTPASLMESTFTHGMAGGEVSPWDTDALFLWLDGLRPVHRRSGADPATLALGAEVFADAGCGVCHDGEALTSNALAPIRGGAPTKTPSLYGLGMHLSYFHDGCAPTLLDRFVGPEWCTGGEAHGATAGLPREEMLALVAWLETL